MLPKSDFISFPYSLRRIDVKLLNKYNNLIILCSVVALMIVLPLFAQKSSSTLPERIRGAIEKYYHDKLNLAVTVMDPGDVTIKGVVPSYWDWRNVFEIVSKVDGVIDIRALIDVATKDVPENIIKTNIQNEIKLNKAIIEPDKIQITANKGLVFLRGTVLFYREAQLAEDIASWQEGVKSVANEIKVIPPPHPDTELSVSLIDMIDNYFPLEKNTVQLKVEKGQVSLSGSVKNLWTKQRIEKEVKRVVGITGVQNDIKVVSGS